jgi:hypothetical protein
MSMSLLDAAILATAGALERPLRSNKIPAAATKVDLQPNGHRSHRDGQLKRYGREVFVFRTVAGENRQRSVPCTWLNSEDVVSLRPLSPQFDEIVAALSASGMTL